MTPDSPADLAPSATAEAGERQTREQLAAANSSEIPNPEAAAFLAQPAGEKPTGKAGRPTTDQTSRIQAEWEKLDQVPDGDPASFMPEEDNRVPVKTAIDAAQYPKRAAWLEHGYWEAEAIERVQPESKPPTSKPTDSSPIEDGHSIHAQVGEPHVGAKSFPKRAAWLKAEMQNHGHMTPYSLHKAGGPDAKTVRAILAGKPVRQSRLELVADALSLRGPKVSLQDIPTD